MSGDRASSADGVLQLLRVGRNAVLRAIGWRTRTRVTNCIDGAENEGAIELMTLEYRPWWGEKRIVDEKIVDWEQDHD